MSTTSMREALTELIAAGDYMLIAADEVAAMIRFGEAHTAARAALSAQAVEAELGVNADLLRTIKEVLRITDRKHDAWDAAKAAIARFEAQSRAVEAEPVEPIAEDWLGPNTTVGDLAARFGARETPEGHVSFGSWMALSAFHSQIIIELAKQWTRTHQEPRPTFEPAEPIAWGVPNTRPTEQSPLMMVLLDKTGAQYPELLIPLYSHPPGDEATPAQVEPAKPICEVVIGESDYAGWALLKWTDGALPIGAGTKLYAAPVDPGPAEAMRRDTERLGFLESQAATQEPAGSLRTWLWARPFRTGELRTMIDAAIASNAKGCA